MNSSDKHENEALIREKTEPADHDGFQPAHAMNDFENDRIENEEIYAVRDEKYPRDIEPDTSVRD